MYKKSPDVGFSPKALLSGPVAEEHSKPRLGHRPNRSGSSGSKGATSAGSTAHGCVDDDAKASLKAGSNARFAGNGPATTPQVFLQNYTCMHAHVCFIIPFFNFPRCSRMHACTPLSFTGMSACMQVHARTLKFLGRPEEYAHGKCMHACLNNTCHAHTPLSFAELPAEPRSTIWSSMSLHLFHLFQPPAVQPTINCNIMVVPRFAIRFFEIRKCGSMAAPR